MHKINSLKTILISVIESIDRYNYLLRDHHRRTATIAYQLACEFGLSSKEISNVVLAASIHDIGALHVSERDKLLYIDAVDTEPHERMGEKIVRDFKPFSYISKVIGHHHINYQDCVSGRYRLADIPMESFFIHLADRIDILLLMHEKEVGKRKIVVEEINKRFGTIFLPELETIFNSLTLTDDFWSNIENNSYNELLMMSLESDIIDVDEEELEALASLFARIVDFKSKWTTNHSKSVSALAFRIASLMELSDEACFDLKIAGYLHDIGKIAIPTEILEKPGSLNSVEFNVMKSHVTYTSLILSKIDGLGNIAKWATSHHEKRDRSGYPLKRSLDEFTIEMDILAYADIISALAEDRPYRAAMSEPKVIKILETFVPNQLDASVFAVINDNFTELYDLQMEVSNEFSYIY